MAIAAVDAHRPDVVSVAELNRLVLGLALARDVAGPVDGKDHPPEETHETEGCHDADTGPDVGASVENLTH